MTPTLRILPWASRRIEDLPPSGYHGVLGTLGYEPRSRAVPLQLKDALVRGCPAFVGQHVGHYETNHAELSAAGFDVDTVHDQDFPQLVRRFLDEAASATPDELARVAIDISSMSRWRIATIVEELTLPRSSPPLVADVLYAPAAFAPPPGTDTPILSVEPVSPYLSGWWDDLDQPLAAIIGVGYEFEHASSAIDRLEPEETYVLVPQGHDARYLHEVEGANQGLLGQSRDIKPPITYSVTEPYQTFQAIETLVRRLRGSQRVALVPLGPKIFAACAALVCSLNYPATQFIRVTANERRDPILSEADGSLCGLRIVVGTADDAALYEADLVVASRFGVHEGDTAE